MITIYCHTNGETGKSYVGQTVGTMESRWKEHVRAALAGRGCPALGAAIRKHGAESFVHEVLEVAASQGEADLAETKWIGARKSRSPDGYNLALGGGSLGYHHQDSKRLIAKASAGRLRAMLPEQRTAYFRTNIHAWTDKRRASLVLRMQSAAVREKIASSQKEFWSRLSPEERSVRVRHQLAGMSAEQNGDRVRKAWANSTPEARAERRSKAVDTMHARGVRPGPKPSIELTPERIERARTMRAAGATLASAAAALGASVSSLHRALRRAA